MAQDITLPVGEGFVNLRVGAIIMRDGRFLMVGNECLDYDYSVGGRVQFGESLEEAVRREVQEETGYALEIDRLGFIHESFFVGDIGGTRGREIYELCFYFYMKTPERFEPRGGSVSCLGSREYLEWLAPDSPKPFTPAFFRTELIAPRPGVRHLVTDERGTTVKEKGGLSNV